MKRLLKPYVHAFLRGMGYQFTYAPFGEVAGFSFQQDIQRLVNGADPVLIDVGANRGQTIRQFLQIFPKATIHAVEPSPGSFKNLQSQSFGQNVVLHNIALGEQNSQAEFFDYEDSCLSSLLALEADQEKRFKNTTLRGKEIVEVKTLDTFAADRNIGRIDLLKIDTQGYDLSVLKGAEELFRAGKVQNVFVEINFVKLYQGQCDAQELMSFLVSHGMHLVDYYDKVRSGSSIEWCNGLFTRVDGGEEERDNKSSKEACAAGR